MSRRPRFLSLFLLAALFSALPAAAQDAGDASTAPLQTTAFTGATVWPGGEAAPLEDATLLVRGGRVIDVATSEDAVPEQARVVDLGGQYVVPGLINAHGHVGVADGLEKGPGVGSAALVRRQLERYARYGITSVVSLGGGPPEAFDVRKAQGAAPGRARLFLSGPVIPNGPEDEVRAQVRRQAARGADWTKLRVDDDLGRGKKMPPALYAAIADASHAQGVPLAAHIVELSDAKGVLRANADLLAHSVRDAPVDEELIGLMRSGGGHCITPTLTREVSTYIYAERPDFFDDPFFRETADPAVIERLQQPEVQEGYTGRAADYYREALPVATDNMMRLHEAGVHVAMGTDSGQPGRFQGYFEHMEMGMMQKAGMTPKDVLRSATDRAADCMRIGRDLGRLAPGARADFLVLGADPLEDIAHLREIEAVYIGGEPVE